MKAHIECDSCYITRKKLIDLVLKQIEKDIEQGDVTSIEEMLKGLTIKELVAFLPEEKEE